MSQAGFTWECSCGHIEYGEDSPEECPKCYALDSFVQLPEEIAVEREKELLESDESTITALRKVSPRKSSVKVSSVKSKKFAKKSSRRKK